jgi:thiol-disulfide isomerase/thioredoxin
MLSMVSRENATGSWSSVIFRLVVAVVSIAVSSMALAQGIDESGKVVNPIATRGGKPVVLVFVRTDCPISHRYAPEIRRIGEKYAGKVEFWLVYPSRRDRADVVAKDLKEFGYKLRSLRDPEQTLVEKAKVQITPEAAVFDRKGELVYHGRIDDWFVDFGRAKAKPTTHDLDDALHAVLSGRSIEKAETNAVGCYLSDVR